MAETQRVTWTDPGATDRPGIEASKHAMLTLIRGPSGTLPFADPPSNGIKKDGSLRFTDWRGEIVTARVGDEIEVTPAGLVLHPSCSPASEEGSDG